MGAFIYSKVCVIFTQNFLQCVTRKLRVSQSSAVEQADLNFAQNFNDIIKNSDEHQIPPQNDGTNACTFLPISIGDAFMQEAVKENGITLDISRTSGRKGHNQPSTKNKLLSRLFQNVRPLGS